MHIPNRTVTGYGLLVIILVVLITSLSLRMSQLDNTSLPEPPLKDLAAAKQLELGNFAIKSHLNDARYRDILTSQFSLATVDNTPNWYFTDGGLRPSATTYNFRQMDQVVAFANTHHMAVQAHHYVWGEEKWLPAWLKNGNYTPAQLQNLIHEHIQTVGTRYKGQIKQWTVVNEAFTRNQHISGLHDWWGDHIKDQSYIDNSFIWARAADPNATLILNDFNNETQNSVSNAMYSYIKDAKQRGIPIDGLGMQMHIDGSHPPKKDDVIANMRRFKALGVETYVTEFDVNMHDIPADAKDRQKIQASIYYEMLRACIESQACHSFAYLGITDAETWYNYIGLEDAAPLPFDRNYQPKPAFYAIRDALQQ